MKCISVQIHTSLWLSVQPGTAAGVLRTHVLLQLLAIFWLIQESTRGEKFISIMVIWLLCTTCNHEDSGINQMSFFISIMAV